MRFVHISDIHAGVMPRNPCAWTDKRALGALNQLLRRKRRLHMEYLARATTRIRSLEPDWVVITGDLTSIGSPDEFALALEALRPLHEGASPAPILFVPGNHDAYVRDPASAAALQNAFAVLNGGRWTPEPANKSSNGGLPAEIALPNLNIFVLDECRPTLPWLSTGQLSAAARGKFLAWTERPRLTGEKRLVVGHYPARLANGRRIDWRRRLEDDHLLQDALDNGRIDVALCGHCHTPFVRTEPSGAVEICAGALTVHGKINVLDFAPLTGRFTQHWEDVSGNGPAMIPLAAVPAAQG
jgi:3',5'-cyclic AMP phosphodiesterase CpdA